MAELVSEIGMGCAFGLLGTTIDVGLASPLEWAIFVVTLLLAMILGELAIYDGLYGEHMEASGGGGNTWGAVFSTVFGIQRKMGRGWRLDIGHCYGSNLDEPMAGFGDAVYDQCASMRNNAAELEKES